MKFGTVINCIDGRVQLPVLKYLEKHVDADYFDACTEAGPLKILTERNDTCRLNSLKEQIALSLREHKSGIIALVGHHDCAGNRRERELQEEQMGQALEYLSRAYGPSILYLGLYVDEQWSVEEICRIEAAKEAGI